MQSWEAKLEQLLKAELVQSWKAQLVQSWEVSTMMDIVPLKFSLDLKYLLHCLHSYQGKCF